MTNNKDRKKKDSLIKNLAINKLLVYCFSVKIFGWITGASFLLIGEWYSINEFPIFPTVILLLSSAFIAFSSGLTNNVFDKEVDEFSKKPITTIFEYPSKIEMFLFALFLNITGLILLLYINMHVFIIGLSVVILGILYSAPPTRFKTRPPLDSIINTLLLGPLPFFLGWTITGKPLTALSLIYGFIIFLLTITYVLIYTSYDIESDKKYGIETTTTKLDLEGSLAVAIITFFGSLFLSIFVLGISSPFTISITLTSLFFIGAIVVIKDIKIRFKIVAISNFFWIVLLHVILTIISKSPIPIFMLFIILSWMLINLKLVPKIISKFRISKENI